MKPSTYLAGLAVVLALAAAPPQQGEPRYQELADSFLRRLEVESDGELPPGVHQVLERRLVRVRLGLFDVAWPPFASRADAAEDYREVAGALLDLQGCWSAWLAPAPAELRQAQRDLDLLRKWVAGWKPARLTGSEALAAVGRGENDLLALLAAPDEVRAASERFAAWMADGRLLGLDGAIGAEKLVLMPERSSFLGLVCFAGAAWPSERRVFWDPSIATWTHVTLDRTRVLALEFADPGRVQHDWSAGMAMDARSPTGLVQQVAQLAALSLLDGCFGEGIPPALAGGLSVNLVVDLYGECDTRVDGDLRARRTEAREMFVPGGLSEGGVLAKIAADSRWRAKQGADRFVSALRDAHQGSAARGRKSREALRTFELLSDGGGARLEVQAPFLGSAAAEAAPPPEDFQGDQLEFLRAYRTCFLHWLRTAAAGDEAKSGRAFGELLRGLASARDAAQVEALLERAYGRPLSSRDPEAKTLEDDFLAWLAKKRR